MVTRDGVKVLDFGLAKSRTAARAADVTLTQALTAEGTVLGTPQYMAPEQFEGKEADARCDVWAFGAVLYEMVTGRRAFEGKSHSSLVAAVLAADPAPMDVKPFTPPWLERLVKRCLAKDPENRWQSMRDIVLELRNPAVESLSGGGTSRWRWVAAAACLAAVLTLGWTAWRKRASDERVTATFEIRPPEGSRFAPIDVAGGSGISPDGRMLAFVGVDNDQATVLYVRPLESVEARALPGTEDAGRPFWSPDSKSLGYLAGGKLRRIDVAGGAPITLCEAPAARGGAWSEEDVILFGTSFAGLQRVSASGGLPSPVTKLNREGGETSHYYPQFLPGGRRFLFFVRHADLPKSGIYVGSLDGKPPIRVLDTPSMATYDAGSGQLLYLQGSGTLMARKLELDPPRLTGSPVVVAERVAVAPANRYANISVSRSGTLLYGQAAKRQKVRFIWRDRKGVIVGSVGETMERGGLLRLSPDHSRIAYVVGNDDGQADVWVLELARGSRMRLTLGGAQPPAVWSPSGSHLYYGKANGIYRKAADGTSDEEQVSGNPVFAYLGGVSPDGKYLVYGERGDLWRLPLTDGSKPEPYLQMNYAEQTPALSPDGRWVAYESNESGRFEIYVQGFPERLGKSLVSSDGGSQPIWSGDSQQLYWVSPSRVLMAARIEPRGNGVQPGKPEALFPLTGGGFLPDRDGRRFLILEPEGGPQPEAPMLVVQNWAARLGR